MNSIDYQLGFTAGYARAKAEVKHGKWEKKGISIKGVEKEFCSECKTWSYGRSKAFCPNCGAKMDGVTK